jgi:hypothetical protein
VDQLRDHVRAGRALLLGDDVVEIGVELGDLARALRPSFPHIASAIASLQRRKSSWRSRSMPSSSAIGITGTRAASERDQVDDRAARRGERARRLPSSTTSRTIGRIAAITRGVNRGSRSDAARRARADPSSAAPGPVSSPVFGPPSPPSVAAIAGIENPRASRNSASTSA